VYWIIDNDPHIDYYDPLIIGAIAPAQLVTDDAQPFPFYGTVEVAWKAGSTTATGPAGGVPDATSGVGSTMRVLLISAEPSPLEFTPISSGPQTVTVTNISKIQLTLGSPALTGPEMADFAIDSGCRGASLAPGATCQIGVTFRPQGVGVRSAELDMVFAGGARAAAVQITGPGLIP